MGVIANISYSSLKDAASEAKDVSRRLRTYENSLNNDVYRKLNSYRGDHSGNIASAINQIQVKKDALARKKQAYETYSKDLSNLKNECERTDVAVKSMVSKLTATFKSSHGISNNVVQNSINYVLTSIKNSSGAGRWISGLKDKKDAIKEYIKDTMKEWWDYDGGKQLVKGVALAAIEMTVAVLTVLTAGGWIALIASTVLLALAVANGIVNIMNEGRAYAETNNANGGDPALAKRRSDENTIQDTIRREFDSKFLHGIAKSLDIVKVVCDLALLGTSAKKLLGKANSWIESRNLKSIDTWKNIGGKIKDFDIQRTVKWVKDLGVNEYKEFGKDMLKDFYGNLNKSFNVKQGGEEGAKALKNGLSAFKDLIKDGFSGGWIRDNIIFNGITVFSVDVEIDGTKDNVTIDDIYSKITKFQKIGEGLQTNNIFSKDVLRKLESTCAVNIKVPEVYVPSIG